MEKKEKLKDGTEVTIRPLTKDDLDALMVMYKALPREDRKYLRVDVTDRKIVDRRLQRIDMGDHVRLGAFHDGAIVADGHLELSGDSWSEHQAEIRVIIARPFRNKGLGTVLVRELYFIAVQKNVETIVARVMRPQADAQLIFRKLGFREETLFPDFVKDIEGASQDLIFMTCHVKDLWKELDRMFRESDWQRCR